MLEKKKFRSPVLAVHKHSRYIIDHIFVLQELFLKYFFLSLFLKFVYLKSRPGICPFIIKLHDIFLNLRLRKPSPPNYIR